MVGSQSSVFRATKFLGGLRVGSPASISPDGRWFAKTLLVGVAFLCDSTVPDAEPEPGVSSPIVKYLCDLEQIFLSSSGPLIPLWKMDSSSNRQKKGSEFPKLLTKGTLYPLDSSLLHHLLSPFSPLIQQPSMAPQCPLGKPRLFLMSYKTLNSLALGNISRCHSYPQSPFTVHPSGPPFPSPQPLLNAKV